MIKRTPAQILAAARAAMVEDQDVTGTLATLVGDGCEVLSAGAVCLLVRSDSGRLELLSSSSHAQADLGLMQEEQAAGPGNDAVSGDIAITVIGAADIVARWAVVGRAIVEGGYHSVHASPMRWRGGAVGALNAFFVDSSAKTQEQVLLAQGLADLATLAVMQAVELSASQVSDRIRSALAGRIIIEQAKGVIAFQQTLDMSAAYDLLVRTANRNRTSLTAAAEEIVTGAQRRPTPL